MEARVLLIDDDEVLAEVQRDYLQAEGLEVVVCHRGAEGLQRATEGDIDLVVLDIMLPDADGLDLLQALRRRSPVPVIMQTARGEDEDRILGLELGADDYVPKPVQPRELLARVRSVLRRAQRSTSDAHRDLQVGALLLSRTHRKATAAGVDLALTSTEFDILAVLLEHAGAVVGKPELSELALGRPFNRLDRSLDMHVSRIRHKLAGPMGEEPECIATVVGKGYQWVR